jgi:hypothetical protein
MDTVASVAKAIPWKSLARQYGPKVAKMLLSNVVVPAVGRGMAINKLHAMNRKRCGMSKKDYRRLGGYKSRVPLCERTCYRQRGKCSGGEP